MRKYWCLCIMTSLLAGQPKEKIKSDEAHHFAVRASDVDGNVRAHPEIDFFLEKNGKVTDLQHASVNLQVPARGELMIWLMPYQERLFQRVNGYGIHAIQVHYANGWFPRLYGKPNADPLFLSRIRLEAATGEDVSKDVVIPYADSVKGRAVALVNWLRKQDPQGAWQQFLSADGKDLLWDKVILAGASHGATTAARFAKHQRVARVVMFAGPRDQYEDWQKMPSVTPSERFFGFTHTLDEGWQKDHYCRSWDMLGLQKFGAVVDVDQVNPPYQNSRRFVTSADVQGNATRAHSCVTPSNAAVKNAAGAFIHEEVWKYLFTHPVDQVGTEVARDPDCNHQQKK